MDNLLDLLIDGNHFKIWLGVVFLILFNLKNISSFIDSHRKKKVNLLLEAINSQQTSNELKEHFREAIDEEYFHLIHKIQTNKKTRDLMISTHKKMNGGLSFVNFERANLMINIKNNKLAVNITWFDWLAALYNITASLIFLCLVVLCCYVTFFSKSINTQQLFLNLFLIVFLLFTSIIMFLQIRPIVSARRIKKELALIDIEDTKDKHVTCK